MKFSLRLACLAASAAGLLASPAAAQFCGVSVDCDWPVPTVGHWAFDDGSGEIATDGINGNNGVWDGGAGNNNWVSGIIGGASETNDENGGNGQEHFTISSLPQLNGASSMTISLWLNTNVANNNNSTYNGLFMTRFLTSGAGSGQNWGLALENNNTPRHIDWRINGTPGPEDDLIIGNVNDQWYHVVMTWDGTDQGDGMGERALFLDGVELQREDTPIETIITSGAWDIGNDTCCGSREFSGTLDDLAVWNSALTADDVADIHAAGRLGVNIVKVEPPQPGDVDLDGDVDIDDFDFIAANFDLGPTATRAQGDLTSDGIVDWADYREWKDNFPTAAPSSVAVPEPTTVSLIGLACLAAGVLRSRQA